MDLPNNSLDLLIKESLHLVEFAILYGLIAAAFLANGRLTPVVSFAAAVFASFYGLASLTVPAQTTNQGHVMDLNFIYSTELGLRGLQDTGRPTVEENKASLEAYFMSRRPFRRMLGQTNVPPYNEGFQGVHVKAVKA